MPDLTRFEAAPDFTCFHTPAWIAALGAIQAGKDPGVANRASPDHDRIAACVRLHTLDIGDLTHISVADNRDG